MEQEQKAWGDWVLSCCGVVGIRRGVRVDDILSSQLAGGSFGGSLWVNKLLSVAVCDSVMCKSIVYI